MEKVYEAKNKGWILIKSVNSGFNSKRIYYNTVTGVEKAVNTNNSNYGFRKCVEL